MTHLDTGRDHCDAPDSLAALPRSYGVALAPVLCVAHQMIQATTRASQISSSTGPRLLNSPAAISRRSSSARPLTSVLRVMSGRYIVGCRLRWILGPDWQRLCGSGGVTRVVVGASRIARKDCSKGPCEVVTTPSGRANGWSSSSTDPECRSTCPRCSRSAGALVRGVPLTFSRRPGRSSRWRTAWSSGPRCGCRLSER
jgi:hypothetical protein